VVIDLTPVRTGIGPARLLDMVQIAPRRCSRLGSNSRHRGCGTGSGWWPWRVYRVQDPRRRDPPIRGRADEPILCRRRDNAFHVVRLAGGALDRCRRRVQQDLHEYRGQAKDPLYRARRTLHTGTDLLTDKQRTRLQTLFANEEDVQVEATWRIYQRMIAAYRD
jgi:hypothetical protein